MRRLAFGIGLVTAVVAAVLLRSSPLAEPPTTDEAVEAPPAADVGPGAVAGVVAGPAAAPTPTPSRLPPDAWTPEAMEAAATRALSRRVADERARLAAAVGAAPAARRADVQGRVDAALGRMAELERGVAADADPIEAYTAVEQVKRALIDDVRDDLGADADPVIAAMGEPDADDPGWGIPVDELGWGADDEK